MPEHQGNLSNFSLLSKATKGMGDGGGGRPSRSHKTNPSKGINID